MDKEEKKFHITKNRLDNEYHTWLSYYEIAIIAIATGVISADLYFLEVKNTRLFTDTLMFGVIAVSLLTVYFRDKLKEIQKKINTLD